jgi:hypothetical protein
MSFVVYDLRLFSMESDRGSRSTKFLSVKERFQMRKPVTIEEKDLRESFILGSGKGKAIDHMHSMFLRHLF